MSLAHHEGLLDIADQLVTRLARRGIVAGPPPPECMAGFLAVAPEDALEVLTARSLRDLAEARVRVAELAARFSRVQAESGTPDMVEHLVGEELISRRFEELQRGTRVQVRAFDTPPYVTGLGRNPVELEMLGRDVTYRVLYDRRSLDRPDFVASHVELTAAGEQARLIDVPLKLVIFDDTHALMPARDHACDDDVRASIVVCEPTLIGALAELFELCWECAAPLRVRDGESVPGPAPGPTAMERAMLVFLVGGFSEPDIAAHLGLHERTVRRHLRDMFDKLGAETRMQAGYQAVVRGWLDH